MPFEIVGREEDRASVEAFVGRAEGGAAALVLEGEAGIGKSTLWLAGVELARARGLRVLSVATGGGRARPRSCGAGRPVRGRPRGRRPLDLDAEATRARDRAPTRGGRQTILSITARSAWRYATCCTCSASGSRFCLRSTTFSGSTRPRRARLRSRCEDSLRARFSCCSPGGSSPAPSRPGWSRRWMRSASSGCRWDRSASARSIGCCTTVSGGRSPARRCSASTSGRAVIRSSRWSWHAFSTWTSTRSSRFRFRRRLDELVRARLAGLPAATRDALALASALGTPSESLLERAGVAADALAPAVAAHVIERENGTIRFTHPLLSSVLYLDLGDERRSVHRRIARIVEDPLLRARHLALSSDAPDAAAAAVLEDAATLAAERGASAVAAELAEQALRLTPPDERDDRRRRALAAARAHRAAGEWTRARTIATDLLAESDIGPLRAEALVLLAELEGLDRAVVLLEEALREATSRPALQAVIQCRLAWATRFKKGSSGRSSTPAQRSRLADDLDDDALRVEALAILAFLGSAVGDPEAPAHAARAHDLASAIGDARLLHKANGAIANVLDVRQERRGGACAHRARVRGMARARRAVGRGRALRARLCRALGRPLAARGRVRRPRIRAQRPVRARGAVDPSADRGDRRPSRPARGRPRALGASPAARGGADRAAHARASGNARRRRTPGWRPARGARLVRRVGGDDHQARLGRGGQALVGARPRRGAARARSAGRRRAGPRRVGGGCATTRTRPGCSRT